MAGDPEVVCYACDRSYPAIDRKHCECGEPLWFDSDARGFAWPRGVNGSGMWRYDALLPVEPPSDGTRATVGGTPLVSLPAFGDDCDLFVKDETRAPTGTFKDRGSAVGVAFAAERGCGRVGTVSHGNMAMSVAAAAADAGLDALVLVPADIPAARLGHIGRYGPTIVRVEGDYGRLYERTLAADTDAEFVNSDTPLRVAGQKTTALEICEAFAPEVPDAIVLPTSSGGHLSATWKGLRELRDAGVIDRLPRLYAIQSAACDPIASAHREGRDVSPVDAGETIAYSIANADPPSGDRALAAIRETGGGAASVPDDEIERAQRRLAHEAGLSVEPASATALAGFERLRTAGEVREGETVVLVATGTGFKEPVSAEVESRTVGLDELDAVL